MDNTDLTFFTNEPERNLYDRFAKILNSKYISYFLNIQFEGKHLAGEYLAINKSTIEQLPFPEIEINDEKELASLAKQISNSNISEEEKELKHKLIKNL